VQSREFSRTFAFETPNAESVVEGGSKKPGDTFSGAHVVYVRAQDNETEYSELDMIGYTAFTITPSSEITRPDIGSAILVMGSTVTVNWDGLDVDSPEANRKPSGYVYKLLRLDTLEPQVPIHLLTSPNILYTKGDLNWTYQDAETTSKTLRLGVPGEYVFGVRAVDIAGAEEPVLAFGRNAFKFTAFSNGGRPTLTIREQAVGSFSFRGTGLPRQVQVPTGRQLRFFWSATAEAYGGTIEAYSWGLDIPDLGVEGPGSGWSGWGLTLGNFDPIVFNNPGIHVLYVRVRDVAGSITLGTLILDLIEFPFDKELLLVDDSYDSVFPRDWEHDAFWRARIEGYGQFQPGQVGEFHAFGDDDIESLTPKVLRLEELGRYKVVVWENRGSGFGAATSLNKSAAQRPLLSSYLSAGGKLWLGGRMTVGAMIADATGLRGDMVYPKGGIGGKPALEEGDFAYDFMKLHSTKIDNDKSLDTNGKHNLAVVKPWPDKPVIYEQMNFDAAKMNAVQARRGISHADAVFDPLFAHSEPGFRGLIDSLYAYGSTGLNLLDPPRSSSYENKLVGLRWHDPDPARQHGRIQWFGFPMYYLMDSDVQETFDRSLDWFQQEQPNTP
jgi:hypothetical protein